MRKIAKITENDRKALFHNTAAKMGMTDAIIEKDFWVCYVLDYLFHHSQWKDNIAFKGGTSLSKAYGLIERFSEDIDLILDWRVLGYGIDEPWENRSNTKQDIFNKHSRRSVFAQCVSSGNHCRFNFRTRRQRQVLYRRQRSAEGKNCIPEQFFGHFYFAGNSP